MIAQYRWEQWRPSRDWFVCYHEWRPSTVKMLENDEWVDAARCALCGTVYNIGYEDWLKRHGSSAS